MSYAAWRQAVANGTMPEYDPERSPARDAAARSADRRLCCINRLVDDPPTVPHQHCRTCGSPLPWTDKNNPECGFFDYHDDGAREQE